MARARVERATLHQSWYHFVYGVRVRSTRYQASNRMRANLAGWESTCSAERVVVLDTISIQSAGGIIVQVSFICKVW
jgi:hypothetical protein